MRIQATREWKSHRITPSSAILGEIKVTASVIHPSRPIQLKGNSRRRLQVGGETVGGGILGAGGCLSSVYVFCPQRPAQGALNPAPCSPGHLNRAHLRQPSVSDDFTCVFLSPLELDQTSLSVT